MFQNLTKFDVNSRCHLGFIREVFSSVLSPIRLLPSFRSSFAKRKRRKGGGQERLSRVPIHGSQRKNYVFTIHEFIKEYRNSEELEESVRIGISRPH